jgi:hypothetical protein
MAVSVRDRRQRPWSSTTSPPTSPTVHARICCEVPGWVWWQFTSVRFTERLDEIGARPSIGTVADSYDNALAETTPGSTRPSAPTGPPPAGPGPTPAGPRSRKSGPCTAGPWTSSRSSSCTSSSTGAWPAGGLHRRLRRRGRPHLGQRQDVRRLGAHRRAGRGVQAPAPHRARPAAQQPPPSESGRRAPRQDGRALQRPTAGDANV